MAEDLVVGKIIKRSKLTVAEKIRKTL